MRRGARARLADGASPTATTTTAGDHEREPQRGHRERDHREHDHRERDDCERGDPGHDHCERADRERDDHAR
jgi:hypothetical protein